MIATSLPVSHDRSLLDTAKALISALGDDVSRRSRVTDVKRWSDRNTGKPPLLKIAYETVEQKVDILRAKKILRIPDILRMFTCAAVKAIQSVFWN